MSLLGKPPYGPSPDDELACPSCATPLLSKKSTCPKCGSKWGASPGVTSLESLQDHMPYSPQSYKEPLVYLSGEDTIYTRVLVFVSGIGMMLSLLLLLLGGFGLEDAYRSFMVLCASLVLLGIRKLVL